MRRPFDSAAALPGPGDLLCLEASAGTGKTWSLATLAARYVVEAGQRIDRVVVITFSRASTRDLRDRVRDRLEAFATALTNTTAVDPGTATSAADDGPGDLATPGGAAESLNGWHVQDRGQEAGPANDVDPAIAALVAVAPAVLAERRRRALAALRDFDSAAIFTTHSFCDGMLKRLGVLVDHDPSDELVVELDDLSRLAVADLYLLRFGRSRPPFDVATARRWAKEALLRPDVPLCGDGPAVAFTTDVRAGVERLKRQLGLYTYDDMPARLRAALSDPVTGPAACDRLAAACPVVLVDEFQDTDPVQWEILERAFLGRSAVVVIGDPKQAIYGFRGADVHTYLAATTRGVPAGLTTNRRSAPPLVAAVSELFGGRSLGDPRIRVGAVEASPATPALLAVDGTPWASPLRLRVPAADETLAIAEARQMVDDDLVADVGALLDHGLRLAGPSQAPRPLGLDDIAVIVSTNPRGQSLLDRLSAAGLPAVFSGAQSVVASRAAADWLTLLRAIADPRTGRVRAVGLSGLVGWTLDDLVGADQNQLAGLATAVRQAGRVLEHFGPPAVLEHLVDQGVWAGPATGEASRRLWTDLCHVADLLGAARRRDGLGAAGLADWLSRRRHEGASQEESSPRRLDTDEPAIRLMTVHQAKGLQFPVVYLPQAADHFPRTPDPRSPFSFHDDQGRRWLDLGAGRGQERLDHLRRHRADEDAEQLRLLYVALTRAVCHVTAWWLPTRTNTEASALHRLLAAGHGADPAASAPLVGHRPRDWPSRPGLAVETMPARPTAVGRAGVAPGEREGGRPAARSAGPPTSETTVDARYGIPSPVESPEVQRSLALTAGLDALEAENVTNESRCPQARGGLAFGRVGELPNRSIAEKGHFVRTSDGQADGLTPSIAPAPARFDRVIDRSWRRTSYSALTASADHVDGGAASDEPPPDWEDADATAGPAAESGQPASVFLPKPPGETTGPISGHVGLAQPGGSQTHRRPGPANPPPHPAHQAPDPGDAPPHPAHQAPDPGDAPPDPANPPPHQDRRTRGSPAPDPLDALSPMADLPGGAAFGSLIHAVFEHADPQDPLQFAEVTTRSVARSGLTGITTEALLAALRPGLTTSLGPLADGLTLADLTPTDRLAELTFELPLALSGESFTLDAVSRLVQRHLGPNDPLAPYPDRLRAAGLPDEGLRGFLTGSIDAVLRLGRPSRYLLVDYKTNRLAPRHEALTLRHYTPSRLAEAMMASHYPLQALLYLVALHRFLRWRVPEYSPDLHLAGVDYLFVRGLAGPDTPLFGGQPCGVFSWRPPTGLIEDLDALLAGRWP